MNRSAILQLCTSTLRHATAATAAAPAHEHPGHVEHELAALFDGRPSVVLAAHLPGCEPCMENALLMAALTSPADVAIVGPAWRIAAASLHRTRGQLRVAHTTGAVRHKPALQTRGDASEDIVWLRDAQNDPLAELAVIAAGERYDLALQWLGSQVPVDVELGHPRIFARTTLAGATSIVSAVPAGRTRARFLHEEQPLLDLWLELP